MGFWQAALTLDSTSLIVFFLALLVAFGFEFVNGFHDTANAVTTVIYTRTLSPTPAVIYSGVMNFLGALITVIAGAGVAFGIVNLLPVDLLVNARSVASLLSVLALLLTGLIWNLSTWYIGLPVSSSHTLIGSILGVGIANSWLTHGNIEGVNWSKATETFFFLFVSPVVGFVCAGALLLALKWTVREPRLYQPPVGDERPPNWIRGVLILTCGGVSFAHGSNDGQKGMGLLLLVLIGFLPFHYALDGNDAEKLAAVRDALPVVQSLKLPARPGPGPTIDDDIAFLKKELDGKTVFDDIQDPTTQDPKEKYKPRWEVRQAIFRISSDLKANGARVEKAVPAQEYKRLLKVFSAPIEYVPLWVVVGTALALGIGTTIGYKRIVLTVAEKIGKTHLTYAQGAAAETIAALTIAGADMLHAPVSTTQVLSSGVAGTMAANRSGIQAGTCRKIVLAWVFTLPVTTLFAGLLFAVGKWIFT